MTSLIKEIESKIEKSIEELSEFLDLSYQETYFEVQRQLKTLIFRLTNERYIERITRENDLKKLEEREKAIPYLDKIIEVINDIDELISFFNKYMDKVIEGGEITTNEYSIMSPYFFQLATDNSCHDMINFEQIEKICAISKDNLLLENNDDYIIWFYNLICIKSKGRLYFKNYEIADKLYNCLQEKSKINYSYLVSFAEELGDYYIKILNRKEAMKSYSLAAEIAKKNNDLEKAAYAMQKYYRTNNLFPVKLQVKVEVEKIADEYGEYASIVKKGIENKSLKRDPVEFTEGFSKIYCEVMELVEEEIEKEGDYHSAFQRWNLIESILEEKYSIKWKNPKIMNPNYMFD